MVEGDPFYGGAIFSHFQAALQQHTCAKRYFPALRSVLRGGIAIFAIGLFFFLTPFEMVTPGMIWWDSGSLHGRCELEDRRVLA